MGAAFGPLVVTVLSVKRTVERPTVNIQRPTQIKKNPAKRIRRNEMAKKIVNIRLRPDQEERINAIVERSAILDTSKFVRIAVDWLLRSDIGEVIKEIVHDEEDFPDYQIRKKRCQLSSAGTTKRFPSFRPF